MLLNPAVEGDYSEIGGCFVGLANSGPTIVLREEHRIPHHAAFGYAQYYALRSFDHLDMFERR